MIELQGVWKGFGKQQVLEDISLTAGAGDRLCIIGQSGSGKSVAMKIMIGILKADKGRLIVDGVDATQFRPKDWTKLLVNFGVVFQGAALFDSLNVLENVGLRLFEERKLSRKMIEDMARLSISQVGLDPGTVLEKYPSELSGGMKKRVGIARAIIHKPNHVFYDEPTTGLDPLNSSLIDNLIHRLSLEEGRTSIIITHDMYTVKTIATKVAYIHNCRLHFFGTPEELVASEDPDVKAFLSRSLV